MCVYSLKSSLFREKKSTKSVQLIVMRARTADQLVGSSVCWYGQRANQTQFRLTSDYLSMNNRKLGGTRLAAKDGGTRQTEGDIYPTTSKLERRMSLATRD